MNILHIDSSIQGGASVSRKLTSAITERLQQLHPDANVLYRDLAKYPIPQFSPSIIDGSTQKTVSEAADARALSGVLDEVLMSDVVVIGAPMYNFSIPSQLKSWLDALVVPGRTFQYEDGSVKGLLGGKRVIIASSRGGFYGPDSPFAAADHQESLLLSLLGFLGITDIRIVRAEGVRMGEDFAERAISSALEQIAAIDLPLAA